MNFVFKKHFGLVVIIILAFLPVFIWSLMEPLSYRFLDLNATTTSLGQITGLIGIVLFSLNLILSSRLKIVDKLFLGMDRAYQMHEKMGAISFSLILFHPILLVVKYIKISLVNAVLFFIPGQNLANTFGIIALLFFVILIVITFYIKIKYQYWKMSHKFLVIVFGLIFIHTLLVTSDISRSHLLFYYIISISILGLIAGSYRAFFRKFINKDFEYLIKSVDKLNDKVTQIEVEPTDKTLHFKSGQFVYVRFDDKQIGQEIHPFSIASTGGGKNLRFVIKSLGDFTSKIKDLRPNTLIHLEGPFGYFSHKNYNSKKQLWIAGGIGITPFLGLVGDLENYDYETILFYCVRNEKEAVLMSELIEASNKNKKLKVILWYSEVQGLITSYKIAEIVDDLENREVFVCGPYPFSKTVIKQLNRLGVPQKQIHSEKFNFI